MFTLEPFRLLRLRLILGASDSIHVYIGTRSGYSDSDSSHLISEVRLTAHIPWLILFGAGPGVADCRPFRLVCA